MKQGQREPDAARKGARTRARIVREAAVLFNVNGFAGTSVSDVSAATGLEKGGVYNHFASKDDLALAAFDYAVGVVRERLTAAVRAHAAGTDQLEAMLGVYRLLSEQPFIAGGCPILNTAVEADDTHPALRDRARSAMTAWLQLVRNAIEAARTAGAFRAAVDPDAAAATIVAMLEGGILLSRLFADPKRMRAVLDGIDAYIGTLRAT